MRSLEAYRKTLGEGTTLVLPPEHEFFRSMNRAGATCRRRPRAAGREPAGAARRRAAPQHPPPSPTCRSSGRQRPAGPMR